MKGSAKVLLAATLIGLGMGVIYAVSDNKNATGDVDAPIPTRYEQVENNEGTGGKGTEDKSSIKEPLDELIYGFGDVVEVNNYAIKFGPEYSLATITNRFADYYGKTAVKLMFTETNNSSRSGNFNHYGINVFNPSGYAIKTSIGALFDDSSIKAGSILPGVTQSSYFYFLYDGTGEYTMEIDDYSEFGKVITFKFNII